jgi:predicted RNA-binding protein with PIN domain
MPYLVDGHNLIGQMHDLSLSDPNDEEKLIVRLRSLTERIQKRITVVFDPNPNDITPPIGHGNSQYGLLTVIYANPGRKADDVIRYIVGDVKDKQALTVITSDAAVANFTRQCGVRVQSSTDFIRWMSTQMSAKPKADAKPIGSSKEVVNWSDVFKDPDPSPNDYKPKIKPPEKPGQKRSEQLKKQTGKKRPLF